MNILNLIHPVQGHECLSACIGNIINTKYSRITANEIIIGGDGYFITYDKERKVIGSPMYEANFKFMNRYEMKYRHGKFKDAEEAEFFLGDTLSKDNLIIIKVDAKQLNYSRVFGQASNSPHFLNVLREEQGKYYICDGYVPTRDATVFEGAIEKSKIINAWKGMEFEYLLLENFPELTEEEILKDVERCFYESIEKYCKGGVKNSIYYGKDAIYQLFFDEQDCLNRNRAYEVNYQLRIYGFLATKEMVCSILQKNDIWKNEAMEYRKIIHEWNRLCMFFLKVAISKNNEQYGKFLQKVKNCIESEERVLNRILNRRNYEII